MMRDELERIWKEASITWSRYCPDICLEELRKNTKVLSIAGVPAEIRTQYSSTIFDLFTRWRSSVSFTPLLLYSGNQPRHPLHRRLGGLQSRAECNGEVRNLIPLRGIENQFLSRPVCNLVAIPTALS
jgi:hypothetical protein